MKIKVKRIFALLEIKSYEGSQWFFFFEKHKNTVNDGGFDTPPPQKNKLTPVVKSKSSEFVE